MGSNDRDRLRVRGHKRCRPGLIFPVEGNHMGMKRYVAKRFLYAIVVVWVVVTTVFLAVRAIPGDPMGTLLGPDASTEQRIALAKELGINKPLWVQYYRYIADLVSGDFGRSFVHSQQVLDLLISVAEPTLSIGLLGTIIALLVAIPAGITSAVHQYEPRDYVATLASFFFLSMPGFWVAIIFVILLSGKWPIYGYEPISSGIVPWLRHLILPALAIGLPYSGFITRMMRSSMLEVLEQDYMRTARAKGLSKRLVIFKHGLQNALIPVVTLSGILLAALLGGVVAIEIVFGIQGLGRLLIFAIDQRDFPVVQGAVIIIATVFVFTNLVIDLLYVKIDPRIQYEGGNE